MSQAAELYWQYIQIEPDAERSRVAMNAAGSYGKKWRNEPLPFSDEEIQRLIREDQEYEQRHRISDLG